MRLTTLSFITLVFLTSCSDKQNISSEMYIGTYRIMDQMVPYPFIIQQKKDTIYLYNNKGNSIDKITNTSINKNKSLNFQEKHLKIIQKEDDEFLAFDLLDTTNFKTFKNGNPSPKNSAKFKKIKSENKLDLQKVKKEIGKFIWKYDVVEDENSNPNNDLEIEKLFYFKNDSLNIITNYYYQGLKTISEYETKSYNIFVIDNIYFLSLQKESSNPQPIYQIVRYDSNKIELRDFSSRVSKNIIFHKESISVIDYTELAKNSSIYSNCFDGYQGEYYFGDDVTFNKGNEYIINYVNENIPKNETNSGYLIVHFNINCSGKVGNFGLIQMNRDFKATAFSKEFVNHTINKVSKLEEFPASNSQLEWLNYKDVHAFLMFKINNGKIVDVCP
ncbi:hypothetical protein [Winogradskyella undariae]|uniref:hypothetical protein n=1 Tax=Winogradskyella undariae TaxID=1285465 RepID=UPI0015CC70C2|nr:hypothetical protein [Winogradskyella undariae]